MRLLVFTAAFYDRDLSEATYMLRRSAMENDIDLQMYGTEEKTFIYYESKINQLGVYLNNQKEKYTHALYTDAADSMILSKEKEIIEKYLMFNSPLVVSGEKGIHPFPELAGLFPESDSPWRFMNPGNFIGDINYILWVINQLKPYKGLQTDDQGHWMMAWRDKKIMPDIDTHCELFQTMSDVDLGTEVVWKAPRIVNTVTNSQPCIIHFNGAKGGSPNGLQREAFYEQWKEHYATIA